MLKRRKSVYMKKYMKKYRAALNCDANVASGSEILSSSVDTDIETEILESSNVEHDDEYGDTSGNSVENYEAVNFNTDNAVGSCSSNDSILNDNDITTDSFNDSNNSTSESDAEGAQASTDYTFMQGLAKWAVKSQISREYLNNLLCLLRKSGHFGFIPKDARTLLQTPKSVTAIRKCGGEYIYFGLKDRIVLAMSYSETDVYKLDTIIVDVNCDGVPIHSSTLTSFWPILCNISALEICPFVVGIYCGPQKPTNVDEYLEDFVNEVLLLTIEGFEYCGKHYLFKLRSVICDAPARAFMKCISGHTSKKGCERCLVEGTSVERRIVYLTNVGELRTNESFRNEPCGKGKHKIGISPLLRIPDFNIIRSCILDPMHLIFQGVCKRFLSFLKRGSRNIRLSQTQIQAISDNLNKMSKFTPSEFARRPRSLSDLDRWKATEFRQFVLYTGIVVLRDVVNKEVFQLFLAFSVAVRILHMTDLQYRSKYLPFAKQLLSTFVHNSRFVCGDSFVTYNVHSLIHIPDDVEYNKCSLSELSSFPFENHLQHIKRLAKNASRSPIISVVKRIQEELNVGQFGYKMKDSLLKLSSHRRDRFFISGSGEYCEITDIVGKGANTVYHCNSIKQKHLTSLFKNPIDSRELGIYLCDNLMRVKQKSVTIRRDEVKQKLYAIQCDGDAVAFFPILHANERST